MKSEKKESSKARLAKSKEQADAEGQKVCTCRSKETEPTCSALARLPQEMLEARRPVEHLEGPLATLEVRGAREHNLKNIDVSLPRDRLVVLTGLSGSGKSSLAFDTIYAEGQRRYVESLSSYARQFLGQMEKPDVDSIDGLSPAISIDQKTTSKNPRSTVGTVTEIYDYLRLLYARAGVPHCPKCGKAVQRQSLDQILDSLLSRPERTRLLIMAPLVRGRKGEHQKLLQDLARSGFVRVRIDGEIYELEQPITLNKRQKHDISVVVDRVVVREGIRSRLADSVEAALAQGQGFLQVLFQEADAEHPGQYREEELTYSQHFACPDCDISLPEIEPQLFSFNNPAGACPACTGLGAHLQIDPDLVIDDPQKSLNEGAIDSCGWHFGDPKSWARAFSEALAKRYQFSLDTAWQDLPDHVKKLVLYGNDGEKIPVDTSRSQYQRGKDYASAWEGVIPSLMRRYRESSSDELRQFYEAYMTSIPCEVCHGARLNPQALAVRLGKLNISELTCLPIHAIQQYLHELVLTPEQQSIAKPIFEEIDARLDFLIEVGLDYMTLARASSTLSGGEAQRIRLATQIGSGLMGVLYILDEPSIGLHQRDNGRLLATLQRLRDLGNTVLVVEHDEETICAADYIVDIGPEAGSNGGEVVATGPVEQIMREPASITGQYLSGQKSIPIPQSRRSGNGSFLRVRGAAENNLKDVDVDLPLGTFICVTGVSGSGKSSLVNGIIIKKLEAKLNGARRKAGPHRSLEGFEHLDKVIAIDQSPIGRTPRSNPATYTDVFTLIRQLYASTPQARARGYKAGRFSFNVSGGRCEACRGDGVKKIAMHFLPDVYVPCEVCHGRRYNRETLEVTYRDKNIADVLDMTIEEAASFFEAQPKIKQRLETLLKVGLGYVQLGQPSTQLSGGEAQRVKLASELARRSTGHTFYILDEPTTGLHSADVHKLVEILQTLTEQGNTVLVIEHNLELIKTADYIVDMGPEGGDRGGELLIAGTPEEVAACPDSYTGQYLRRYGVIPKNR